MTILDGGNVGEGEILFIPEDIEFSIVRAVIIFPSLNLYDGASKTPNIDVPF